MVLQNFERGFYVPQILPGEREDFFATKFSFSYVSYPVKPNIQSQASTFKRDNQSFPATAVSTGVKMCILSSHCDKGYHDLSDLNACVILTRRSNYMNRIIEPSS